MNVPRETPAKPATCTLSKRVHLDLIDASGRITYLAGARFERVREGLYRPLDRANRAVTMYEGLLSIDPALLSKAAS